VKTSALDYDLPAELIATRPAAPRDAARLLVVRSATDTIEHTTVAALPDLLHPDDLVVRNETKVMAARLSGTRPTEPDGRGGGRVEGLYLGTLDGRWEVMLSASGRLKVGDIVHLGDEGACSITLEQQLGRTWLVRPRPDAPAESLLATFGLTPVPPYILKARKQRGEVVADVEDRGWYETSYARDDRAGSVAAPTAGLHFTPALLNRLRGRVPRQAAVTLHVGVGTFTPVSSDTLEAHTMHEEDWSIEQCALDTIRSGPGPDGRLIAIGTTTVRALESLPEPLPATGTSGSTELMIAPGYTFRHVQGLLTNFHLPRSTLLALVGALLGLDRLKAVYREAVARQYRFYSYGDAMLILP